MKYLKMLGLAAVAAMALMAIGASAASATTLEVGGVAKNSAVTITASLEPGTSAILKDELGSTTDTCTESTVHGATVSPFTATNSNPIGGPVSTLDFGNCSHTTDVIANGSLSVSWINGTTDGTVSSSGAQVKVRSTFFGITANCDTGAGTDIGRLTGTGDTSKHATMDISATLDCTALGNGTWTGSYTVTSPTGLGVVQ